MNAFGWTPMLLVIMSANPGLAGQERLTILAPNGAVVARVPGDRFCVVIDAGVDALLRTPGAHLTLTHNHPNSTGLSADDIDQLAKAGVGVIEAVGADGSVYRAARGPMFEACRDWAVCYQRVDGSIRAGLDRRRVRRGPDILRLMPHLVSDTLRKARVLAYDARLAFNEQRAMAPYRKSIDSATTDAAWAALP